MQITKEELKLSFDLQAATITANELNEQKEVMRQIKDEMKYELYKKDKKSIKSFDLIASINKCDVVSFVNGFKYVVDKKKYINNFLPTLIISPILIIGPLVSLFYYQDPKMLLIFFLISLNRVFLLIILYSYSNH